MSGRSSRVLSFALVALGIGATACADRRDATRQADSASATRRALPGDSAGRTDTAIVRETWISTVDASANVDGPAMYHGADGARLVLASAKSSHEILVYDANTGRLFRRIGRRGRDAGEFRRPNGILVVGDSLLFVVERDNARVQVLALPSLQPLGTFGERLLRLPYGIAVIPDSSGALRVYVTDNYETPDEQVPPLAELGERVKLFRVRRDGARLQAAHIRSFGDTTAAGAIRVTESIRADAANDRLLIAEELETDSHIKVYDLEGRFTGEVFGRGRFPQQAEGIVLYACDDGGGYWVTTDQGDAVNTFHLWDRKTLSHVAAFTGARTRRTDGVALSQRAFGPFPAGVLLAAHLDAAVAAMSWADIARATGVRGDCVG